MCQNEYLCSKRLRTVSAFSPIFLYSFFSGGHQHLRYGMVRQPHGIHSIPVPVAKMYKNIKWWTENEREGRILLKAEKEELKLNFKEQLNQVWEVSLCNV